MSVEAINGADQQTKKFSSLPAAAAGTVLLGAAGAGAGYMWGGKTPSLEEVFAQEPDTFKNSLDAMKAKDGNAAGKIETTYNAYQAKTGGAQTTVDTAVENIKSAIEARTDYENKTDLDKNLNDAKDARANAEKTVKIDDKEVEVKYSKNLETDLKTAEEELKKLPKDAKDEVKTAAEKKVADAKAKVDAFADETKKVKEAEDAIFDAKATKFKADESDAAKGLRQALDDAKKGLNEAKSDFLKNISEDTKKAFGSVKKALTEGKGKAAMIYGGIAAAVGLAAGLILGGSKKNEAAKPEA